MKRTISKSQLWTYKSKSEEVTKLYKLTPILPINHSKINMTLLISLLNSMHKMRNQTKKKRTHLAMAMIQKSKSQKKSSANWSQNSRTRWWNVAASWFKPRKWLSRKNKRKRTSVRTSLEHLVPLVQLAQAHSIHHLNSIASRKWSVYATHSSRASWWNTTSSNSCSTHKLNW